MMRVLSAPIGGGDWLRLGRRRNRARSAAAAPHQLDVDGHTPSGPVDESRGSTPRAPIADGGAPLNSQKVAVPLEATLAFAFEPPAAWWYPTRLRGSKGGRNCTGRLERHSIRPAA